MDTPTALPISFAAGTSVTYLRSHADYPASRFALKLHLRGIDKADIEAEPSAEDHLVKITAKMSELLRAGHYSWVERFYEIAGDTVADGASGMVEITPDLASAAAGDLQPWAEKMLAAVEQILFEHTTDGLASYVVSGPQGSRQVVHMTRPELWDLRRQCKQILGQALDDARNPAGGFGRKLRTRFVRP